MKRYWDLFCVWCKRHGHANRRSMTGWNPSTHYEVGDVIYINGEAQRIIGEGVRVSMDRLHGDGWIPLK